MELRDLRLALRRHRLVSALAFLVCVVLGFYAAYSPNTTYEATATLSVEPNVEGSESAAGAVQDANYVIPSFLERLRSSGYRAAAAENLSADAASAPVKVRAEVDFGTGIIRLSTTARSADIAAKWGNAIAEQALQDPRANGGVLAVTLLEPARASHVTKSPQRAPIAIAAIVLGMMAAVFAALIASLSQRALDPAEEVRGRLGVPLLATIPNSRSLRKAKATFPLLVDGTAPEILDSFRTLRTEVEFALDSPRDEVIVISSLAADEGKTTIALGLAMSFAAVEHDVALVDAAIREPALHAALGIPLGGDGLADWAIHDHSPELRPSPIAGLSYLPAGTTALHPADATALALPRAVASYSRPERTLILVGPPIEGIAEAPVVLAAATHVIIVIDSTSVSRRPELEQMMNNLRARDIPVLGVVLNRTKLPRNKRGIIPTRKPLSHTNTSIADPRSDPDNTDKRKPPLETLTR